MQKVVQVVVVDVTRYYWFIPALLLVAVINTAQAAVVPEDRTDILYHSYSGGGITVDGPSILVRKGDKKSFSVFGQYYVDSISSASIDVEVSGASRYSEERTEHSLGIDYVRDKTTLSFSHTTSSENDYEAKTFNIGVSQDMFGDLTTISLGYSQGDDIIRKSTDSNFEETATRKNYRLGISQVLTKDLIMSYSHETVSDQGYLQNPYRSRRYLDATNTETFGEEFYPHTRTSVANAIRAKYYLPYRAAIHFEYRKFDDDWDIKATQTEIGYTHPFGDEWIFDVHLRNYEQSEAHFYSDLFASEFEKDFMARDKELSNYTTSTIGFGVTYEFAKNGFGFIDRGSANLFYDRIQFDYNNFSDLRGTYVIGDEPLYSFSADVIRLFVSLWY